MPFKQLGLNPLLLEAIKDMRYTQPTPVQEKAIPYILQGRDIIATAQTGTGKTAAFLLPILHQLIDMPRGVTRALIISPTRELSQQIDEVCLGLAYHTGLKVALLVGGAPMFPQEKVLRAGAELVIATPGRLLDHMRMSQVRFDELHTFVLDEADRMLDMGFMPDIKRIIGRLPARQQTLMFSATMPPVIVNLAKELLKKPLMIQVGKRSAPAVGITQAAYPVAEPLKKLLLRHLLRNMKMPSVLIFTRTKQSAHRLARYIADDGFKVAELHGNLTQPQRDKALDQFRRGEIQALVATNIAARGLDVEHISHVISFDVPNVPEDYVHRIGRTARAKAKGDAFILVSPAEEKNLLRIERQIGQRLPRITLPDFDYEQEAPARDQAGGGRGRRPSRSEGRSGSSRSGSSRSGSSRSGSSRSGSSRSGSSRSDSSRPDSSRSGSSRSGSSSAADSPPPSYGRRRPPADGGPQSNPGKPPPGKGKPPGDRDRGPGH
jgi:ATP-dependent RNA helicase RhlE